MNSGVLYVLTDGKGNYIRYDVGKNQYVKAKGKYVAERWLDRTTARNVLKHSLPKNIRKKFKVVEVEDDRTPVSVNTNTSIPDPKIVVSHIPAFVYSEKVNITEPVKDDTSIITGSDTYNDENTCSNPELRDKVVNTVFADIANRKVMLNNKLSEVDRKICDVLHYIEFNKLNACDGYKTYKTIREYRLERRAIKDEIEILDNVYNNIVKLIEESINRLNNRKYKPRELPELFKK